MKKLLHDLLDLAMEYPGRAITILAFIGSLSYNGVMQYRKVDILEKKIEVMEVNIKDHAIFIGQLLNK